MPCCLDALLQAAAQLEVCRLLLSLPACTNIYIPDALKTFEKMTRLRPQFFYLLAIRRYQSYFSRILEK